MSVREMGLHIQSLEIELMSFARLDQHQSLKKFLRHPWREEGS
jgi:hypothetical protein